MGGQANIDPPPSLRLFFFSFSTQPRQMGINRKSRKWLKHNLVVKCSRLNFYFKRNFEKGGDRHTRNKNFEAWVLWMWSNKLRSGGCWLLRWRIRGQKHYRWIGQIGALLLTQPDTCIKAMPCPTLLLWLFFGQRAVKGLCRFSASR